jgi:hypothetical protein
VGLLGISLALGNRDRRVSRAERVRRAGRDIKWYELVGYVVQTYGANIHYVVQTYGANMWCRHMVQTYTMWCRHVVQTYTMWCKHTLCGANIWCNHVVQTYRRKKSIKLILAKGVTGVFQGCFRGVSGVFQGCFRGLSGVFQGCFRGVMVPLALALHHRCYRCNRGATAINSACEFRCLCYSGVREVLERCYRGVHRGVKEVLQNCYGGVMEVLRGYHRGVTGV